MSNCTCTSCNEIQNTSGQCLNLACSLDSLTGKDDSCKDYSLGPVDHSIVTSSGSFKPSTGSNDDVISLKFLRDILSGGKVVALDDMGQLGAITAGSDNNGLFLGVVNGKWQAMSLSQNLLRFNAMDVGSDSDGFLAVFGCGPNGTYTLSKTSLRNCSLGVDGTGKLICINPKVCLKDTDAVLISRAMVVLNEDGCLAKMSIPNDGKCYQLIIRDNKFKIVEQESSIYFHPSKPVAFNAAILAGTSFPIDFASYVPKDFGCFKSVKLRVRTEIQGASRSYAGIVVTMAGYVVADLTSYWYNFAKDVTYLDLPFLNGDYTVFVNIVLAGDHNVNPQFSVQLVGFNR